MKKFKTIEIDSTHEILLSQEEPIIYKLKIDEILSLSDLYRVHNNTDKIIVFFNGAINGDLNNDPTFMRWSWANENNLSFICFDDPIVSCTQQTNLGWYIGTSNHDIQEFINDILEHIIKSLKISPKNIIFYGSSGGGFAAMMAAIRLRGSVAVVSNPQTNIFKYYKTASQRFIKSFFENEDVSSNSSIYYRFSVSDAIKKYNYIPAILYIQNIQDKFHLERHLLPLQQYIFETFLSIGDYPNKIHFNFFNDSRGHSSFSNIEDFLKEIEQAKNLVKKNISYPSLFNSNPFTSLSEKIIWHELQTAEKNNVEVSFELNFEPLLENIRPAILLIDTDKKNYHELKKHGYSFSKSLNFAFKYIDGIKPNEKVQIIIPKDLGAKRISLRKWKCIGDLHSKNFEVKVNND